jgi:RNA-binding protein
MASIWYDAQTEIPAGGFHAGGYNRRMPASLTSRDRAQLKARAHALDPVVRIGHAGVTPELAAEVDRALTAHGLIKIGIAVDDRDERRALGDALAERVDATPVHRVGKILILWRPRPQDT